MSEHLVYIYIAIFTIFILVKLYLKRNSEYWSRHGVTEVVNNEITGHPILNILNGVLLLHTDSKIYQHAKSNELPYIGHNEFTKPVLFVLDLELIKNILVKDFDVFTNRRIFPAMKSTDPTLFKMLFFLEDGPWRELRGKLSPTFTSGKIKGMFRLFNVSCDKLIKYIKTSYDIGQFEVQEINDDENGNDNEENEGDDETAVVDLVDVYGRYLLDVIASVAFGLDAKTFDEPNSMFQQMAKKWQFDYTSKLMKFGLMMAAPKLAAAMKQSIVDKTGDAFFTKVIMDAIRHREAEAASGNQVKRNDFLQLILEARDEQLKMDDDENDDGNDETENKETKNTAKESSKSKKKKTNKVILSDDVIVAQSIQFIVAGFDTLLSLLLFASYELALNPKVQEKLWEEIEASLIKTATKSQQDSEDKFTYEAINQLEYLDMVINETLRKYPPVPRQERRATTKYKIPNTSVVIEKDVRINIPTYAIHHDEEYYPNPYYFDPERFNAEAKAKRNPYAFQPFGHGPRSCIGMRFALTNAKKAIASMIHHFKLEPCEETPIPMKFAKSTSLKPEGRMFLKLIARRIK